jgi:hypothetical protein
MEVRDFEAGGICGAIEDIIGEELDDCESDEERIQVIENEIIPFLEKEIESLRQDLKNFKNENLD